MNSDREASRRRRRRAERENERGRRAHAEALARWRLDEAELRTMLDKARAPWAIPHDRVSAPVELRRDETVLWQADRTGLTEAAAGTPVLDTGYGGFSLRTVRPGDGPRPRVEDEGAAIVTDQRVIFRGERAAREWDLRRLTRFAHDLDGPTTLMHVSDRERTSGLVPYGPDVAGFRFAFTLAVSMSLGRSAGFAAHLESLLAGHRTLVPVAPPATRPDEVRYGFWRTVYPGRPSMPGWLRAAQGTAAGTATILLAVAAIGAFLPASPATPTIEAAAPTAPAVAVVPTETASPTPSTTPTPRPTRTLRPPPKPTPKPAPKPTADRTRRPSPPPSPEPRELCGAPQNPYGYNLCGGRLVFDPAPGTCRYFDCTGGFNRNRGFMIQCGDGTYGRYDGGGDRYDRDRYDRDRDGGCSHHGGFRRPVFH